MPDIVITPNRGTSTNPKIDFTGVTTGTIKLEVLTDGSLSFNGANGSLFSIADSVTGSLMSVNDTSGLPILEVFSADKVVMGKYNSNALVVTGSKVGVGTSTPGTVTSAAAKSSISLDTTGYIAIRGNTVLSSYYDRSGGSGDQNDIYGNIRVLRSESGNADGMFIGYGGSGGNLKFFSNSGTTEYMTVATDGQVYATNSVRSPIFYDKDDTNYYLNPAGTSVLGSTYISSHLYTSYNSVNPEIRTSGSGAAGLVIRDSTSAFRVQLYGDGTQYGFLSSTWGAWDLRKVSSGNLYFNNDSTYYINTTAGSNLNGTLINNGGTAMTGGWNRNLYLSSTFPVIVFNSSNTKYSGIGVDYSTTVGGMYFWVNGSSSDISGTGTAAMSINTGNYVQAYGSFRAPIFYDTDNTGYYADPSSTSNLNGLTVNGTLSTTGNTNLGDGNGDTVRINDVLYVGASDSGDSEFFFGEGASLSSANWYGTRWYWDSGFTHYWYSRNNGTDTELMRFVTNDWNSPLYISRSTYFSGGTANSAVDGTVYITADNNNDWGLRVDKDRSSASEYGVEIRVASGASYGLRVMGSGTEALRVQGNGMVIAGNRFQAPIFYDSDNTGYYVDPNGTTNINTVYTADVYSSQWFRNSNSGYGLYNQSTTNHFYSDDGSYYNIAPGTSNASGLRLRTEGYGGTIRGYFYANSSNDVGILNTGGNWRMKIVGGDYGEFGGSSVRAQIFYDSNDTGYYVNPNGTSQLNYVLANDWFRPQGSTGIYFQDYGYGLRSAHGEGNNYGNAATYGVGRNGWSGWGLASRFCLMTDVNNGGNTLGMHDNSYSWIWRWIPDQYFTVDRGYSIFANSARAPIFYDSNNTGYYVDPDSTSVLNNLQIVDGNVHLYKTQIVDMSNTSTYSTSNYYPVIFACPVNGIYVQIQNNLNTNVPSWATHGGGFTLNLRWWTNGSGWGTTSVKRVIEQYYEAYANQTICGGITQMTNGSVEVVWLRGGGNYRFIFSRDVSASAQSGTYTNNGQSVTAQSSAVNNVWEANSGYHKSYANVFIDSDNAGYYVDPSSTSVLYQLNTNYNIYPQNYGLGLVGVYSSTRYQAVFSMGDSYKLPADGTTTGNLYGLAWSHPNAGGVAGNLNTHGLLAMENGTWLASVSGSIRCRDDMRSPVFYDSNDTNYFVNPNGNSSVTLNFDVTGAIGATDDVRSGLRMYDTTAMAANVGGQIVLGYKYTAGGNLTEGAIIKMYKENATDGHYGSGLKFQVRNTGEGLGTRVWIDPTGNLISDQSVRGPIFYDTDNTYYYSDPGSNSRIYNLQVGNTISDEYGNGIIRLFGNLHIDAYNGYDIYANYYSGRRFRTFYSSNTESFRTDTDGIVYAYSQFRTPLMYDYNNTGYYVDPASTSVTSVVKANYFCGLDSNAYGQYKGYDNNNHFITIRGAVSGTTTTPTITGAHQTTLVEYAEVNDSTGWFFKTAGTGNYDIVSRITRSYSSFEGSARSPLFYDSNDTNYFLDPASTSYLWRPDAATQQRWNIHFRAVDAGAQRPSQSSDSNYWTTTIGWGTNYGTWSTYWKYGFGGFDCWGTSTDHPQGSGYVHAQGIQSGQHYTTSDGSTAYGWQMVGAADAGSRWWLRGKWGGSTYSWYEIALFGRNVGGNLYADAFYDSGNTGYYCDPNGTSNLNALNVNGTFNQNSTGYYSGVNYFYSNKGNGVYLGSTNTAGVQAYSTDGGTAMMSFHRSGSYAVNMGLDPDNVFRIGGWSASSNRLQLNMSGDLWSATSMRSSVFYDQDDTSFYLDPAGSSVTTGMSGKLKYSVEVNSAGSSAGYGLALYPSWTNAGGTSTEPTYGIMFASTSTYGTHGNVSASGDWSTYFTMNNSSNRGWIFRNVNSGNVASINNVGYARFQSLGINTNASGTAGEIRATDNITAYYSDERLKTKLGPIENPIEKVKALSGFYFEANETAVALGYQKKREVGVSAQEVQAILPEIIAPAPISDEYMTVRYEKLIPLLIEAIKEQQTQIESLRNELTQLKSNK